MTIELSLLFKITAAAFAAGGSFFYMRNNIKKNEIEIKKTQSEFVKSFTDIVKTIVDGNEKQSDSLEAILIPITENMNQTINLVKETKDSIRRIHTKYDDKIYIIENNQKAFEKEIRNTYTPTSLCNIKHKAETK